MHVTLIMTNNVYKNQILKTAVMHVVLLSPITYFKNRCSLCGAMPIQTIVQVELNLNVFTDEIYPRWASQVK